MMWTPMLLSGGTMLLLGVGAGLVLGWAKRRFHVEVDPRIDAVNGALPAANCGACGYIGCGDYAAAVVEKGEKVDKCTVGGPSVAAAVADIMGVEVEQSWPLRPVVHCRAAREQRLQRQPYTGEPTCAAANLVAGVQGCTFGCLGLGDCERACDYDALYMKRGLATIDYDACIGCSACERACPRHIISMVPFKAERMLVVGCSNTDFGKDVQAVCKVGCTGCKVCERLGAGLFKINNNLPIIDYNQYDPTVSQAKVLEKCPAESLVYVGKPPRQQVAEVGPGIDRPVRADFKTTADEAEWRG